MKIHAFDDEGRYRQFKNTEKFQEFIIGGTICDTTSIFVFGTPKTHEDACILLNRYGGQPDRRTAKDALAVWLGEIIPGYEYHGQAKCECNRCCNRRDKARG